MHPRPLFVQRPEDLRDPPLRLAFRPRFLRLCETLILLITARRMPHCEQMAPSFPVLRPCICATIIEVGTLLREHSGFRHSPLRFITIVLHLLSVCDPVVV